MADILITAGIAFIALGVLGLAWRIVRALRRPARRPSEPAA